MRLFRSLTTAAAALVVTSSFTGNSALIVTSKAFKNDASIPVKYSCEGGESSPPLLISNVPANAKSLALILHDPDAPMAGGFTHWVMWNIPPTENTIAEDFKGAEQGLNGQKQKGYKGMCPPSGTHHYHFMVYALDTKLTLDKTTTDKAALEAAMQGHILSQGEIVGLYKKTKP